FSSRRRHTRSKRDWSSDVCSSDLFNKSKYNNTTRLERNLWRKGNQCCKRTKKRTNTRCETFGHGRRNISTRALNRRCLIKSDGKSNKIYGRHGKASN